MLGYEKTGMDKHRRKGACQFGPKLAKGDTMQHIDPARLGRQTYNSCGAGVGHGYWRRKEHLRPQTAKVWQGSHRVHSPHSPCQSAQGEVRSQCTKAGRPAESQGWQLDRPPSAQGYKASPCKGEASSSHSTTSQGTHEDSTFHAQANQTTTSYDHSPPTSRE